jgi:type IV secretory pathway TrbD component
MKKSTATDQYRLSYGPAKIDAAMARFDAKIRRAITRSILDLCRHIMHLNVADNIIIILVDKIWINSKGSFYNALFICSDA